VRRRGPALAAACAALAALAPAAHAWPEHLMQGLARDARRLLPNSLNRLIGERQEAVFGELRRFPLELSQALARDLRAGRLRPETEQAVQARLEDAIERLRGGRVSEGLVLLASTLRVPADLSDPVLAVGPAGHPPGVVREYYAFVDLNLDKLPVVLQDRAALELTRDELPAYWRSLLARSRDQAPVLRTEMWVRGRVVDHRRIDLRSPVYGVAQSSYSRAVNAIAATWLAAWREANGDLTRRPSPSPVRPRASNGGR
jgi:hypothetical protein